MEALTSIELAYVEQKLIPWMATFLAPEAWTAADRKFWRGFVLPRHDNIRDLEVCMFVAGLCREQGWKVRVIRDGGEAWDAVAPIYGLRFFWPTTWATVEVLL